LYIDTHLHLDPPWLTNDKDRQKVVEDISSHKIITLAQSCDIPSYEKILEYSKLSEYIFPSFGILPWYAHEYVERFDEIQKLCEGALMLGEIGLDEKNARDKSCIPHQRPMFDIFLKVAEKQNLILNLHFRGTEREGLEILNSYSLKKPIFHNYSGSIEMMDEITEKGYYYSMGPPYFSHRSPSNQEYLKNKIQQIPEDLLLLELDVLPHGKDFQVPSKVFEKMLEEIATVRNISPNELEIINQKNFHTLIGNDSRLSDIQRVLKANTLDS
jgi:TatD DNase family protein